MLLHITTARQRIPKEVKLPLQQSCQGWHGEKTGELTECDEDVRKEGLDISDEEMARIQEQTAIAPESNFGIKQCFSSYPEKELLPAVMEDEARTTG